MRTMSDQNKKLSVSDPVKHLVTHFFVEIQIITKLVNTLKKRARHF